MWSAGCLFLLLFVVFWGFCVLQGWWGVIEYKSCCRSVIKILSDIELEFCAGKVDYEYLPEKIFQERMR